MKKNFILFIFLLCSIVAVAQKKSITGIITDTAGEAVIGASIVEVGTTNGTVSDVDGNFTLSVSENASIQVSFIGFSSQTLSVKGKTNFKIVLKEDFVKWQMLLYSPKRHYKSERTGGNSSHWLNGFDPIVPEPSHNPCAYFLLQYENNTSWQRPSKPTL
jgi:hypothetical protein